VVASRYYPPIARRILDCQAKTASVGILANDRLMENCTTFYNRVMNCGIAYHLKTGTHEQEPGSVEVPQKSDIETERCVRCKKCDHKLTNPNLSIKPYEGTFRNPLGISFHVVFYSDAAGVRDLGSPTTVSTWFPGYGWSFALCRQCEQHVGWWWSGPGQFIGLISTRILR